MKNIIFFVILFWLILSFQKQAKLHHAIVLEKLEEARLHRKELFEERKRCLD